MTIHGKSSVEYENATYILAKTALRDACKLASTSNKDMGKKDKNEKLYVSSWIHLDNQSIVLQLGFY